VNAASAVLWAICFGCFQSQLTCLNVLPYDETRFHFGVRAYRPRNSISPRQFTESFFWWTSFPHTHPSPIPGKIQFPISKAQSLMLGGHELFDSILKSKSYYMNPSLLFLLLLAAPCALAGPLIRDDFNRDGSLAGSDPRIGTTWSGHALPVNGAVYLGVQQGMAATRFDPNKNTTLYAGFDLTINRVAGIGSGFVFSFMEDERMIGRVFLLSRDSNQSFRLGIENNLDNPIEWPANFTLGTTLRVVVGLSENGSLDRTSLWINPVAIDSPYVFDTTQAFFSKMNGVVVRSTASGSDPAGFVDNLYVGSDFAAAIPEPASFGALLASVALVSAASRKARRRG